MNPQKFRNAEIIGAAATVTGSFLFHFLYVWTQNGLISLVQRREREHLGTCQNRVFPILNRCRY